MKKGQNVKTLATAISIVVLVWLFLVVVMTFGLDLKVAPWGVVSIVAISAVIAEIYLLGLRNDPGQQATETASLGVMATIGYMAAVLVINTLFALMGAGDFGWALVAVNVVATAIYVIVLLTTERQTNRVTEQLVRTQQKINTTRLISAKLGELLAAAEDPEVRDRLLKLKESVDYSTNISTDATAFAETQVLNQLDEILKLMLKRTDKVIILDKLGLTERTWKMRSSAAATLR